MVIKFKKYIMWAILIVVLSYGLILTELSYRLIIQHQYWILYGALIVLFLFSIKHLRKLSNYQLLGLVAILAFDILAWMTIPYLTRIGIFVFSTLCFLYSGVVIFHSRYITARILFILTYALSAINFLAVLFYIAERSIISKTLINSLFISNSNEIQEYLWGKTSIGSVLIVVIFLLATFLLFIKRSTLVTEKINLTLLTLFLFSFGISFATGPTRVFVTEFVHYQYQKMKLREMVAERKNGIGNSYEILQNDGAKKIMVIIGESLNKKYMSLYGYEEETSPNLQKMTTDSLRGKLICFSDVISPEVTTVPSLEKVLTNRNNKNGLPFEKSISILDIFKKANYETLWISNHPPLGQYDTPTSVIASTADYTFFSVNNDSTINVKRSLGQYLDGDLLAVFKNKITRSSPHDKQIYFVHLMGSHFNYSDRYPKKFDVFKSKSGIENDYINSILYNDWVVSNLVKIAQDNSVDVVFYFSDHGENLRYQHNENHYDKGMSEIPFIVYLSNDYIENNKILANSVVARTGIPAMTDNFFHDIQGITGVISSLYSPTESFISPEYMVNKRRVVDDTIAYD